MSADRHQAAFRQALELLKSGQVSAAEAAFRGILSRDANHGPSLHLLGAILAQTQRYAEAAAVLQRAGTALPQAPEIPCLEGRSWAAVRDFERAAAAFERAFRLNPRMPEIHNDYGNALRNLGRLEPAAQVFTQALELNPRDAVAWNRLGLVREALGQEDQALRCYREALALRPDAAEIHLNLGSLLARRGELDAGIAALQRAIAIRPDYLAAWSNLGHAWQLRGELERAMECYHKALELDPEDAATESALLFTLNCAPDQHPEEVFAAHKRFGERYAGLAQPRARFLRSAAMPPRLRIGYISRDFWTHSVACFLEPLLAAHDPARFEVICYSDTLKPDETTARLKSLAHGWKEIAGLSDQRVADMIMTDGIEVLIDLAGHTAGNRLLVFARRAAPVQVTYLGYPNTTGLNSMDIRITDAWADPPLPNGRDEPCHTEHLERIEGGFLCYGMPRGAPDVGPLPAHRRGTVTFGSFNQFTKINRPVLEAWAQIIRAIPGARLLLKASLFKSPQIRDETARTLESLGIPRVALDLRPTGLAFADHMALYNEMDIALDPFPYNGTTTTCEALWMGVPVLTLAGRAHAGRVGTSLLHAVGLPEFIASSIEDYIQRATALASNLDRLDHLRQTLRDRMQNSPLMNAPRLAHALEAICHRAIAGQTIPGR